MKNDMNNLLINGEKMKLKHYLLLIIKNDNK